MVGKLDKEMTIESLTKLVNKCIDRHVHTHEVAECLCMSDDQYKAVVLREVIERNSWKVDFNLSTPDRDGPERRKEDTMRMFREITTMTRNIIWRDYRVLVEGTGAQA